MGKRSKNADITEEQMLGYLKRWGGYNINPWRAARQHKELLDDMAKRGLIVCGWGRKHCLHYVLTRSGKERAKSIEEAVARLRELRAKENPA